MATTKLPSVPDQVNNFQHMNRISSNSIRACSSADSTRQRRNTENLNSFEFFDKTRFAARAETSWRRSRHFCPPTEDKPVDVWAVKPPDFNPQAFSTKTLERNSRAAIRPEKYDTESSKRYAKLSVSAADRKQNRRREEELATMARQASFIVLPESLTCRQRPQFEVQFHILDSYEAKLDFVKSGMYPSLRYQMPKPHDFRQYPKLKSLGLPDFMTSFDHDPMGIKFKAKHLATINGPALQVVERDVKPGNNITNKMQDRPPWQKELILPKTPFPNKMNSYSRHRRTDRSARSAFLERAEAMMRNRAQEMTILQMGAIKTISSPQQEYSSSIPPLSTVSRSAVLSSVAIM